MYIISLAFIAILFTAGCATQTNLSPAEHQSLHPYNKKPGLKPRHLRQMHKLHEIDEKKAQKIAEQATGEKVSKLTLKHEGQILFYFVITPSYQLLIDAKDGTLLKKVRYE